MMSDFADHEARSLATRALDRQDGHETLCTERWRMANQTMTEIKTALKSTRAWMISLMTAIVVALIINVVVTRDAKGHEFASLWIMQNPLTASCCGPKDCRPLEDRDSVELIENVWRLNGWPVHRVYPSQDEQARAWGCFNPPQYVQPRCLFLPGNV